MRRVLLLAILIYIITGINMNAFAEYNADITAQEEQSAVEEPVLPSIFIWQLPESEINKKIDDEDDDYADKFKDEPEFTEDENYEDIFITEEDNNSTIKGYLNYLDDINAINLDVNNEYAINTRVPQKLKGNNLIKNDTIYPVTTFSQNVYSRTGNLPYNIAPFDTSTEIKKGHISVGTSYNESIDNADLGFTTSFYTKYDTKHFSLSTSYDKNLGVAYNQVIDKFSLTPEIKINRYLSLKDTITSDITRNRTKNEIMLSIKPTKDDRVRFEFGTNYTFDRNNDLIRSQVKFQTQFKL